MSIDRVMSRIQMDPNTGCWLWEGACNGNGYAVMSVDGKIVGVHRWLLEQTTGPMRPDQHACHKCDTTNCVNPQHMFAGSAADNARDRERKHRGGGAQHFGPGRSAWAEEPRPRTQAQKDAEAKAEANSHGKTLVRHTAESVAALEKLRARFPDETDPHLIRLALCELAAKKGNR